MVIIITIIIIIITIIIITIIIRRIKILLIISQVFEFLGFQWYSVITVNFNDKML